ncbi:MAG: TM2 domain-containing protein [Clostridia bacterium]|nr:TM2 domain-containing protein [Clostridia bacterium]
MENNKKSKIAAGLLGVFLGSYGIHNFYLGYTNKGITQLVLSLGSVVLSIFLWFLGGLLSVILIGIPIMFIAFILDLVPFGVWVWGLIEGIQILSGNVKTDANGVELTD